MTILEEKASVVQRPRLPWSSKSGRRHARQPIPKKVFVGAALLGSSLQLRFAPLIQRYPPLQQNILNRLTSPNSQHWLGTDDLGRDVWSRLVHATGLDLQIGFLIGFFCPMVLGTFLGAIAGFYGKIADTAVMRVADVVQASRFTSLSWRWSSPWPRRALDPHCLLRGLLGPLRVSFEPRCSASVSRSTSWPRVR